jgi:hypothetical protein
MSKKKKSHKGISVISSLKGIKLKICFRNFHLTRDPLSTLLTEKHLENLLPQPFSVQVRILLEQILGHVRKVGFTVMQSEKTVGTEKFSPRFQG